MEHPVTSRSEWLEARKRLLRKEKELTRQRDLLSAERRALPWVRVDAPYTFDTEAGKQTLAELFDGRSQLVVYHFMFAPEWEQGCKSCSFWAEHYSSIVPHLAQRDVRLVAVSRAPLAKLAAFARRLGWTFPWVSSGGTTFNYDFHVSFEREGEAAHGEEYNYAPRKYTQTDLPGISVFAKDPSGSVFHTYSCFARGIEGVNATYGFLDLVPKGRDEADLAYPMAWVKLRDEYEG